ncbi:pantoate--beta-alanine ligase [Sciscionella marina]|uniref:pantoate--beta-alanine ligase n=1 Tax=Sciscionella marina TaxID=508770 RepID=UPI00037368D6|nr:pantoate--beta-alanine ligase [Sciscionella marina]
MTEPTVYRSPAELAKLMRALRGTGRRIALVPTMGALHTGHAELIARARRVPGTTVVVSIFVNPLQFGPDEDFDRYPRAFDSDVATCASAGAEFVFAPPVEQMYPEGGNQVTVQPGPLGAELEGAHREGHFAGMLTVVAKLFNIVRPDYAYFGEKDYQQLVLVKRMAAELNMGVDVIGIPTVREPDGLAISSRNVYLSAQERESALAISAALTAARAAGRHDGAAALAAAHEVLAARPEVEPDYVELRAPDLGPAPVSGQARMLIAAKLGKTRLIDNSGLTLGAGE